MHFTFEDLIAPLTYDTFSDMLRAREVVLRRSAGTNRHAGLLTIDDMFATVTADGFPLGKMMVIRGGEILSAPFYCKAGKVDRAKLKTLTDFGASLVVNRLHEFIPALGAMKRDVSAGLREDVEIAAILSMKGQNALALHFDPEDIAVLQIEGTKRWNIYADPVRHPVRRMIPSPSAPKGDPVFSEVLEPGDFLFVPAGFWHRCENGPGNSLHMGIAFTPPNAVTALRRIVERLATDEAFRTPLTRMNAAEAEALQTTLKQRVAEVIDGASFSERTAVDG